LPSLSEFSKEELEAEIWRRNDEAVNFIIRRYKSGLGFDHSTPLDKRENKDAELADSLIKLFESFHREGPTVCISVNTGESWTYSRNA
jgi:hypothetical protein